MMRLVDLFAGCGGMSLGFQSAGFNVVAAYDNWQPAIDIYQNNFSHPIFKRDLSSEDITQEIQALAPDIIIGGPPCQDFSIAGKRNFEGERANLTLIYANIIKRVLPKWFVMENVYNIEKSPILKQALDIFKSAGYGITKRVWDASYMGVPQMRKRYIIIGRLSSNDDFMLEMLESMLSASRMTLRDYLGDSLGIDYYYMHPRSYNRRGIFSIDEPSATIRGVNRPLPEKYIPHPADKTKELHKVRALTSVERSYIQTFPKNFKFIGAKTDIEQAIGNAVPVKMAEFIAKGIIMYSKQNG